MLKKAVSLISFILFAFIVLIFCCGYIMAGVVVELKKEACLDNGDFCLSDISSIKGGDAGLVDKLGKIIIGETPLAIGLRKNVPAGEILLKIKENGLDASIVKIEGASSSVVYPKTQKVLGADIVNQVKKYIDENMPWEKDEAVIQSSNMVEDAEAVAGDVEFEVTPLSQNEYIGLVRYSVIISVKGIVQQKVDVALKIAVYKKILVALKALSRGDVLDNQNFGIVRREITANNQDALTNPNEVLGMVCSRSIPARGIIKKSYLSMPVAVRKDELVKVIFESNGLSVQSVAVARDSGSLGGFIRVQNIDSKKMFFAKIVGSNIVSINDTLGGNDLLRR